MEVDAFSRLAKCLLEEHSEEDSEEDGGKYAVLFYSAADVKCLRGRSIMNDSPLHVVMEGHHDAEEFWRAADFFEDLDPRTKL